MAPAKLGEREIEVLRLLAGGLTVEEASKILWLTPDGVKSRLRVARRRLGAATTLQAAVMASELGLLGEVLPTIPAATQVVKRRVRLRSGRKMTPYDADAIAKTYPSIRWGEKQWVQAFDANPGLAHDILRGIGRATVRSVIPPARRTSVQAAPRQPFAGASDDM